MPQQPRPSAPPPTTANEVFTQAMAAVPSPSSPSEEPTGMSRQELAEAVNAELARQGSQGFLTDMYVGRIIRGETRWPRDQYRAALRTVLGVESDRELGFYRNRPPGPPSRA